MASIDGAIWIWNIAQEHFPNAVHIVDIYHAREHVWNIANAIYGSGEAETATWAKKACDWLNEGEIERLIQEIEASPLLHQRQVHRVVFQRLKLIISVRTQSVCNILFFGHKECIWEAGLLKLLVKPLFPHVRNDQECVGLHKVSMLSLLYAPPCSTKPTKPSSNHVTILLLDCLQLFHTPNGSIPSKPACSNTSGGTSHRKRFL